MLHIPVPRVRGDLVAYFGARADYAHRMELFCTYDNGLFILTEVETRRYRGTTAEAWLATHPGRTPAAVDLADRVDQRVQELTTTTDDQQALTILLRRAQSYVQGSPRFCVRQVDTPAGLRGGDVAPLPAAPMNHALPVHPLLWQAGQALDHLPYRLHRLAHDTWPIRSRPTGAIRGQIATLRERTGVA